MLRLVAIFALVSALSAAAAGVVSGIVIKGTIDAGIRTQQQKLHAAQVTQQQQRHTAQVNACLRQNARQAASNRNALATWREDALFASALTARPSHRQTAAQQRLVHRFHGRLDDLLATLTWTPLLSRKQCAASPATLLLPVAFGSPVKGQPTRPPTQADLTVPKQTGR